MPVTTRSRRSISDIAGAEMLTRVIVSPPPGGGSALVAGGPERARHRMDELDVGERRRIFERVASEARLDEAGDAVPFGWCVRGFPFDDLADPNVRFVRTPHG